MQGYYYDTKIGRLFIAEEDNAITHVELWKKETGDCGENTSSLKNCFGDVKLQETEILKEAAKQLIEYFNGARKEFTLQLNPKGTSFQQKVWNALRDIPYGETRSYRQIAEAVGNEKASRAVGMANHNNPIMLFIPCHRVIGANGKLVGYAGGLEVKEFLLRLEQQKS